MIDKICKKVYSKGGMMLNNLLYEAGIKKHACNTNKKIILCYHGIDLVGNTKLNSKFISKKYFEKQLVYFKENFNIVSLKKFFEIKNKEVKEFTIAITFDDGYKNNFKYVLPLIEKHKIPVAFFVTGINRCSEKMLLGDFLDLVTYKSDNEVTLDSESFRKNWRGQYIGSKQGQSLKEIFHKSNFERKKKICALFTDSAAAFQLDDSYDDYWQQMSNEEIIRLSKSSYASIGVHGFYHNDLSLIPLEMAKEELIKAKYFLENLTQVEMRDIAFPYGNYNHELLETCEKVGFDRMLALEYLYVNTNDKLFERFGMNPFISWNNQLEYLLKGRYV